MTLERSYSNCIYFPITPEHLYDSFFNFRRKAIAISLAAFTNCWFCLCLFKYLTPSCRFSIVPKLHFPLKYMKKMLDMKYFNICHSYVDLKIIYICVELKNLTHIMLFSISTISAGHAA